MKITKIVLTGGPCAGKSTARNHIKQTFEKLGYGVMFVSETATDLITGGLSPWTMRTVKEFQEYQVRLQIDKEDMFMLAAQNLHKDKVLVVCDRGVMDTKAFITAFEWENLLKEHGYTEEQIFGRYDAVFHLVTAAKGAPEFYTLANNSARTETVEQAKLSDERTLNAWTGHPHLRVIDNSADFETKMHRLVTEITSFLGEPEPYEIERKFLIKMPDVTALDAMPNCTKVEMLQTYLMSDPNEEVRVRQRGKDGSYTFFKTVKKNITEVKRIENEVQISQDEYVKLLMQADLSKHQIRKTRYCIMYRNQYFELDIYPFWNTRAVIEIELNDENAKVDFPPFVEVLKEVTYDQRFRNSSLATDERLKNMFE